MPAEKVTIKPTNTAFDRYYREMDRLHAQNVRHETALRTPFTALLTDFGKSVGWTLITEENGGSDGNGIRYDGMFKDANTLRRGYWESKDPNDKLDAEILKKTAKGYSRSNILYEDSLQIVLIQGGVEIMRANMRQAKDLAAVLSRFFSYTEPDIENFKDAVAGFKEAVPDLATDLMKTITDAHRTNKAFQTEFEAFFTLCQTSLNKDITWAAVDEMLIQHLLTERLIRVIFNTPEFVLRNVIAGKIEEVITALTSQSFSRDGFLSGLSRYFASVEAAARTITDFQEKQDLLNTVYEQFFQGYSTKIADTHGIVYTPQPIVDFMCASVIEVLGTEFGKTLGDPDVVILDPCTGTGNFIVNLIRRANAQDLPGLYQDRLFANEIMLLPYYVAALNIEHAYYERVGHYEPFAGLCFVDTLDIAQAQQMSMFSEPNTARVERQKKAAITVIIGNPPYNVGQASENDNNKNRKYPLVDRRIKETYAKDSKATNKNALGDAYVKFFRWAADRLGKRNGIVCYVTNNSFVDQIAFDGMRKHLLSDFTQVYHLDLHGNVRQNPKLSGTTHNVFGIQVGAGITVAIRKGSDTAPRLFYHRVPEDWRKEEKYALLTNTGTIGRVTWQALTPNAKHTWRIPTNADEFASFFPIGGKESKAGKAGAEATIFQTYSGGVKSNRDDVVYDFNRDQLMVRMGTFVEDYNAEVDRYKRAGKLKDIDSFVNYGRIKWDSTLKRHLKDKKDGHFDTSALRTALYRPFTKRHLYFDRLFINSVHRQPSFFPPPATEQENRVILSPGLGNRKTFGVFMTNAIVGLDFAFEKVQCFPFYTYDEDGTNRRENITDGALGRFRDHYGDSTITKWDVFYYVYALLHHPGYREKFAGNLKRELPRIPFAPAFRPFADAGRALADLHLGYESITPHALYRVVKNNAPANPEKLYRIEKMRLNKDKTALTVNDHLMLTLIPPAAFEYTLGSRSALEWVIDQYQVGRDKAGNITSDPNRPDDPEYIVNLVGRVVAVSLATVKIVAGLPLL